jgi:serine/threonine protein kinase
MPSEPNVTITEKLRLDRKLSDGGMGSVWLADHRNVERKVVVKLMAPRLLANPAARELFLHEARAVARLQNRHVPQILEVGETRDGVPFMAMELLKGEDLHDRLARTGPLTLTDTVKIVSHVATALGEAHSLGMVHRDVKPENIFIVPDDDGGFVAKLIDFGISMDAEMSAPNVTPCGTPSYMSPEQLMAERVDARSDLWSLGVVAYECIVGRPPFAGGTFVAVRAAIARPGFAPPGSLCGLPPAVDAWFVRALSTEPANRFPSARVMSRALRSVADSVQIPFLLRRRVHRFGTRQAA